MGSNEALGNPPDQGDSTMGDEGLPTDKDAPEGFTTAPGTSAPPHGPGPNTTVRSKGEEGSNPSKRRRALTDEEVGIFTGLTGAVQSVADAFKAPVVVQNTEVPPNLYSLCMATPGFVDEDLMAALSYLTDNKRQAESFVLMTDPHRVLWIRQHLAKIRARQAAQEATSE